MQEKKELLKFLLTFAGTMHLTTDILKSLLKRKLVTTLFIGASVAAFATLGDGGPKFAPAKGKNFLALPAAPLNYKNFSLRSGYQFRGNSILNTNSRERVVMLNTVMTYQVGNTTYVVPLKKKLLLGKVTFNPAQR